MQTAVLSPGFESRHAGGLPRLSGQRVVSADGLATAQLDPWQREIRRRLAGLWCLRQRVSLRSMGDPGARIFPAGCAPVPAASPPPRRAQRPLVSIPAVTEESGGVPPVPGAGRLVAASSRRPRSTRRTRPCCGGCSPLTASPVRTILDLGSGGGHVACYLKDTARLTLIDISAPDARGVARTQPRVRAHRGRHADAAARPVLRRGARARRGGLRDHRERPRAGLRPPRSRTAVPAASPSSRRITRPTRSGPSRGGGGGSDADGRQASFRERTTDPDPADEWIESGVRVPGCARPTAASGSSANPTGWARSALPTWVRVLTAAGFVPEPGDVASRYAGPAAAGLRHLFIGRRPPRKCRYQQLASPPGRLARRELADGDRR